MAKGIELGIAAETRAFTMAIESGVIAPLDDAVEALDDLGKARGPEQLERGLKDAQKATDNLQRETKETAATIERDFRESYRAMRSSADAAMGGAKGKVQEFKQEAIQNFSEVTSSFDGSMESVTDLAQGTFGGLAMLAGPAGLAAGAAAVGVGLISTAIKDVGETTEENKQKAAEWAQSYIEAGGKILSSAQVVAAAQDIITDPERYEEAKTAAEDWGVSTSVAVLALAGDANALAEAQANLATRSAEANAKLAEQELQVTSEAGAVYDLADSVERGTTSMRDLTTAQELGAQQADVYSESLRLQAERTAGAKKEIDEFGDAVYTLPDGSVTYIDAETGKATQNVADLEKRIFGLPVEQTVAIKADTTEYDSTLERLRRDPLSKTVNLNLNGKSINAAFGQKVI